MYDIHAQRCKRIEQFTHYLKLMHHRAHVEQHGCCFLIFSEELPDQNSDEPVLYADVAHAIERGGIGTDTFGGAFAPGDSDASWRRYEGPRRFIQFSFERSWFCMDIPRSTLFRFEAARILRQRSGFFYLRDLPQFTLYGEDVEGHDPFRKVYLYGDERSAAEDTAYIFFDVWGLFVDTRIYVEAAAFGDGPSWEQNQPLR